jgi:hypothetical protein
MLLSLAYPGLGALHRVVTASPASRGKCPFSGQPSKYPRGWGVCP